MNPMPLIHHADIVVGELKYRLILVASFYASEGTAILEVVTTETTPDGEPKETTWLDNAGEWRVRGGDGPSVLHVTVKTPEDLYDPSPVMRALLVPLHEAVGADAWDWSLA